MAFQTQYWNIGNNTYLSAVLNAVEKERHGNVMFEPDITMFNGEEAHVVSMTQQSYISSYEVNQNQYDPQISSLSYGTVLDVQPIISSDKKFITLTVKPTHSEVVQWRSFKIGYSAAELAAQQVTTTTTAATTTAQTSVYAPMTMPEISYQSVRTSVTIPDGGSIMLAGMNTSASKRVHTGVPFLSHIPFLGRLFSSNGRNERLYKTIVILQADIVLYDEIEKKL
jgi:general secretion pathway protein D